MVDPIGRKRLVEDVRTKFLIQGIRDSVLSSIKATEKPVDTTQADLLQKIGLALAKIYNKIPTISFPKIQQISGTVRVSEVRSMPPLKVSNFAELVQYLKAIEARLGGMTTAISMIATQKPATNQITVPEVNTQPIVEAIQKALVLKREKLPEIKTQEIDIAPIIQAIREIQLPQYSPEIRLPRMDVTPIVQALQDMPVADHDNTDMIRSLDRVYDAVASLANRPSMTTPPVTHMSLNSLNGAFHTTTMDVGTSAVALPATSLANRRAIILYNNHPTNTLYLGDSNVATSGVGQGIPVPASSYSPIFDAGATMTIYGIAKNITSVTILEMSDESSGR